MAQHAGLRRSGTRSLTSRNLRCWAAHLAMSTRRIAWRGRWAAPGSTHGERGGFERRLSEVVDSLWILTDRYLTSCQKEDEEILRRGAVYQHILDRRARTHSKPFVAVRSLNPPLNGGADAHARRVRPTPRSSAPVVPPIAAGVPRTPKIVPHLVVIRLPRRRRSGPAHRVCVHRRRYDNLEPPEHVTCR